MPITRLLVADRDTYQLTLYKRPLLSMKFTEQIRYPIAVGREGYRTPRGLYLIHGRSKCPTWTMPESSWVPQSEWGTTLSCDDPRNPIRYRWLGIHDGVGIHGIPPEEEDSVGTDASHGCLRMHKEDIIELYPQVPKYCPIYII
jgi:lipoprotein-anchoring transpeptidase ErfK/SrfK